MAKPTEPLANPNPCLCGRPKAFNECCGRFINGLQYPKTPEQLMRSRYSAYALGGCGDYLLATWHPMTSQGLTAQELSRSNTRWSHLEVLEKSQQGDNGFVEFKAYFIGENDQLACLHEKSVFKWIKGRWHYVGGEVVEW